MEQAEEIQNDRLYDIARISIRNKVEETSIIQQLESEGISHLQAVSIVNTTRLQRKATIHQSWFIIIICTLLCSSCMLAFSFIPYGSGGGVLNYALVALILAVPLVFSYAINHSIVSLEMKKMESMLYIGFIVYLVAMIAYLTWYKFSQDRPIWEALLFIFIAIDFNNLFKASNKRKSESPQYYLEIKAYQGEQKKYKIFKRIIFSSTIILLYTMLISSVHALAGVSYLPFGIAVISFYWIIMGFLEMNDYKKLI